MAIPIYIVTGFLDSGKTTLLNMLLNGSERNNVKVLVLQFENGEETFKCRYDSCHCLNFSIKKLEQQPKEIVGQIEILIRSFKPAEVWIEWNGILPFSELQVLFLDTAFRGLCKIKKVIHVADAEKIENLLAVTGGTMSKQIANSDFAVVCNVRSSDNFSRIRRLLKVINPGIRLYKVNEYNNDLRKRLLQDKEHPINIFFFIVILLIALHLIVKPALEMYNIPVNMIINVFLGIILQAFPFLLIGVLLSSAIQIFVSRTWIERRFPKSPLPGMSIAILCGFCLPVCDCASIPIFKSLVRKGIPIPAAVTFMTVTPVINPVVILSTYYAFNGSLTIVAGRVFLGILSAIITGLIFTFLPPKHKILSGGAFDRLMCGCGCYGDIESTTSFSGKIGLFIRHSQAEFFSVGKYLIIGTFISSLFQAVGRNIFTPAQTGAGLVISILVMMVMAFLLSLCSSSDAVIARSFANRFPQGAIMAFMVFGPMMDIKNVMMLSSGFSKRFIVRLFLTAFIVCFAVVFLIYGLGGMK